MTERSLQYRPYLDGLRGVAVLLVFVFHAARAGLPGGFIGVDIFFVLSGYLITRILIAEYSMSGRIRISDFYARRIRRLMPAVIVVVLVVVAREAFWGDILELGSRLKDSLATLFYVENWNLIVQADEYFQEATSASPLRHAWSLSIEEQFYVLWPLALIPILALGKRHRRRSAMVVLGLALLSALVMALVYKPELVVRAYYGTDSRVHQPLIGAVLALLMSSRSSEAPPEQPKFLWPLIGAIGLSALLVSAVVLTGESSAYYQGGSLLIALATAMLILALEWSPTSGLSTALAWNPIRQLGRISYGFYLWHWPIILWLAVPVGIGFWQRRVVNLAQFGLTLAISVASFWIIENPIRERQVWFGKLKSVGTICVGIATLMAAGVISYTVLSPDESSLASVALQDRSYEPCPDDPQPCVKVEGANGAPTVVLIGDSTAQSYDPALKELAHLYGFRYVQAAVGGCPLGHRLLATGTDGELHKSSNWMCYENMPAIYQTVIEEYDPDLIIATSWNETNQHVEGGHLLSKGTPEHLSATEEALRETVDFLMSGGARFAFLEVLPPGKGVGCIENVGADSQACVRLVTAESGERPYNEIFEKIAEDLEPQVVAVSLADVVCPNGACPLTIDNIVMRYDGGHFTGTASRHLAPIIDRRLLEAGIDLSMLSS